MYNHIQLKLIEKKKNIYKKTYLITIHITGQIFQHFFHVGANHLDDSFFHHWVTDINSKENCGCLGLHAFPTIIFCGCSFVCAQAKFSSLVMINTFPKNNVKIKIKMIAFFFVIIILENYLPSVIQMLEVFSWNFGSCFAERTLKSSTYKLESSSR